MPRYFTHFIFILFTITSLSGLWMRFVSFQLTEFIPYANIMLGHSHLVILGWAFMGVLVIFFSLFWKFIQRPKEAKALMISLFIISIFIAIAFFYQGFGVFSMILLTLHIIIEYWTASFIYREIKNQSYLPKTSRLFINGGLIALIISSLGPISSGVVAWNGIQDSPVFNMAFDFYLHFQNDGWLYLMLIGLFVFILQTKKIPFRDYLLKIAFWSYFIALFPGYYLSIFGTQSGTFSNLITTIGSIGQWFGVLCIIITFREIWVHLYKKFHEITIVCLWITFFTLMVKSTMELGLIAPVIADLVYQTRSMTIGYLHFTLLGFVSIFIFTQLQFNQILQTNNRRSQLGFVIFLVGFFINELTLFGDGLAKWSGYSGLPYLNYGLLIAGVMLFIGILLIWVISVKKTPITD